ncbi:MAG: hypothetical protein C4326_13185 [Ignavibacteria bacterium]
MTLVIFYSTWISPALVMLSILLFSWGPEAAAQQVHTAPVGKRFIRLQVIDGPTLQWGFDGLNGRQYETTDTVLTMIRETDPDVLDRLYNGPISDLNARLRYRDTSGNLVYWQEAQGAGGFPPGSVGSWLYRASNGRIYYPRLGMNFYDPANDSSFFSMAQTLYNNTPIRSLMF